MRTPLAMVLAAFAVAACHEIPQDAKKPFASAEDTKAASPSLAKRADYENEYLRTGDAKAQ